MRGKNSLLPTTYSLLTSRGFTLIEIMIAVGLFTVIMVVGIGAVLSTNQTHKVNQNQRQLIDNLSFVMEDMSRNLRLGSYYRCPAGVTYTSSPTTIYSFSSVVDRDNGGDNDCDNGTSNQIAFHPMNVPFDPSNLEQEHAYVIFNDGIYKTNPNPFPASGIANVFTRITPTDIVIDQTRSGFTVIGTGADGIQPRVIIRLSGTITLKDNVVTPFDIETTVSQRLLEE
jgi:prepilin-type N-terminal cleavage/methylation domain-containing protein